MKTMTERYALPRLLVLLFSVFLAFQPVAFAQDYSRPAFAQEELDQMLAPIALYPDPLLSQILMASTYPREVVEAARWSRAHRGFRGDQAVRAVADQDWDPSVKSLVAFPQILATMDQKLDWTERLGDAFLAQESQVMNTVQDLRQRAYTAGNLRSNNQIRVHPQGTYIAIEPASPQMVYVPYYDPLVVYGPWWWPAYRPVYWAPWPGYSLRPGYAGFAWGTGIGISVGFFFGNFDWHQHHARVVNVNNYYYNNRTVIVNREVNVRNTTRHVNVAPGAWQHDPAHRRGAPYRVADVREKFAPARTTPDARRDFRGHESTPAPAAAAPARQERQPERRGADARARMHDNSAPNSNRPEPRGSRHESNRETVASHADRPAVSQPSARANSRPPQPAVERQPPTPARPSQPAVERQSRAPAPPRKPAVEQQSHAPIPPPQGYVGARRHSAPQEQASARAQRPSGKGRSSLDSAKPHDDGDKRHEKK